MTALARSPSAPMRARAIDAFSRLGGLAASQRDAEAALVTMAPSGWFTSCAMEAVSSPSDITRVTCASSERAARSSSCARVRSMNCASWEPTVAINWTSSESASRTSRLKNSITPAVPNLNAKGKANAA